MLSKSGETGHLWNFHIKWSLLPLLSRFSHVRLSVTPETAAHQAPPSLGFSRQEHWSGLPFPSPMHESENWKGSRLVLSDSSRPHGLQPTRLLHPWDFPGKSTGVGCHRLLLKWSHTKTNITSLKCGNIIWKNDRNKLIYKIEKEWTEVKNEPMVTKEETWQGGLNQKLGMNI